MQWTIKIVEADLISRILWSLNHQRFGCSYVLLFFPFKFCLCFLEHSYKPDSLCPENSRHVRKNLKYFWCRQEMKLTIFDCSKRQKWLSKYLYLLKKRKKQKQEPYFLACHSWYWTVLKCNRTGFQFLMWRIRGGKRTSLKYL